MEEQETTPISRKDFLVSVANGAILSVVGIIVAFPIVRIFFNPLRGRNEAEGFVPVAKLSELRSGKPIQKSVVAVQHDAWNKMENVRMGSVWLIMRENGEVRAFSSICPHLGCLYSWNTNRKNFICPCHTSGFTLDGKKVEGPSPRDLDSLNVKVVGKEILVQYQRFLPGIAQKKVV